MKKLLKHIMQEPSPVTSWIAGMGLVMIWGMVRLVIFSDILLPLSYVLPLLIAIWARSKHLLWTMAGIFVGMAVMEFYLITPDEVLSEKREIYVVESTILNILIAAPIIHLIILLLDRLEESLARQLSDNEQIRRQNEMIRVRSDEILILNDELNQREEILQKLLDSARLTSSEPAVMEEICNSALKMMDVPESAIVVYEMRADRLMILSQVGLGVKQLESWPVEHSFTKQVIREGSTSFLEDARLRPELSILSVPGHEPFRSVLCAPMRIEGSIAGAIAVYSRQPTSWTDRQLHLAEWVATRCGHILETLRMQDALRRHRDHLDELVRERTLELEDRTMQLEGEIASRIQAEGEKEKLQRQLLQAQKMEALGRFAGGIAHDLNNILSPVIISTEILLEDAEPDSPSRPILEQVLQAAYRQRDLIKQILSFSRKHDKKLSPIRLTPLVQETFALLRPSLPAAIEIRCTSDARSDTIMGDSTQIQQVVMNLVKNAADALGTGPGTIETTLSNTRLEPVRAHRAMKAGEYLVLTVSDTGSGMTPEIMDQIFEPFFTTKDSGRGTGMGLAVVHGIVKDHGGTISVESEKGKGSVFTVYFPLTEEKVRTEEPEDRRDRQPGQGERILLVDDEKIILSSTQNALRRMGYEVSTALDSREAISLFAAEPDAFDLVITDMTMPGTNGLVLAKKLKRIRPDVPVILCTGYSDIIDENLTGDAGICRMLRKPAGMSELKAAVRDTMEKNGGDSVERQKRAGLTAGREG